MSAAASRRGSAARGRPTEENENENQLSSPIHPPLIRPPRSPLLSIQDPSRNPRPDPPPDRENSSDPKQRLSFIPTKGAATTPKSRERGSSSRARIGTPEAKPSLPVQVPYFELGDDPSFWREHNVQVLIRIRPISGSEIASQGHGRCLIQESSKTLLWSGHPETRFTFDHVACESMSQEKLFEVVGLPMVENCMSGYNSCMFAYGQTGSGKTYTMMGEIGDMDNSLSEHRGMTPRVFEYLFTRIREEEEKQNVEQLKYSCKCSFLEIYNEQITDLLEPTSTNLQLREDIKKGVYVEDLRECEVSSVKDVFELLLQGAANRKMASTNMNSESSRSHSVFTCVIESRWEKDSMTHLRYGRLNLVDLAGSERQKSSGAEGERLKEAANINKSLSTLGLVIMTLVDIANGKNRHVPYRDSRLTFLLQDSLGGNSKTAIIANVSPSTCSASETLSTLKFAQRAKLIQNNAKVNEDASGDVMALQQQIQILKDRLTFLTEHQINPLSSCHLNQNLGQAHSGDIYSICNSTLGGNPDTYPNLVDQKIEYLEIALAGALRREKVKEAVARNLEAEITHMNRLVHQREADAHQIKMMLRFREEKLKRLELLADDLISSDEYLRGENATLSEEIRLLRERIDRNPELTQFALENMRLLEQIRTFENFYQQGEREALLTENSHLRNQLLKVLEAEYVVATIGATKNDDTIKELESCRRQLGACLQYNARLSREVDDLHHRLECHQGFPQTEALNVGDISRDYNRIQEPYERSPVGMKLNYGKLDEGVMPPDNVGKISHIETDQFTRDNLHPDVGNVQKKLRDAQLHVKAMELQHAHLIEKLDSLQKENCIYLELLESKVGNVTQPEFHHQLVERHKRTNLNNPDADEMTKHGDTLNLAFLSTLQNCQNTSKDVEDAKTLHRQVEDDHVSQVSFQDEVEQLQQQVDNEIAKKTLYVQGEVVADIEQDIDSENVSVLSSRGYVSWRTKYEEIHHQLYFLMQENMRLSNLVAARDAEISASSDEWEKAIIELTKFLTDGCGSLEDANDCVESVVDSFPQRNDWINEHVGRAIEVFIDKEKLIASLEKSLEDAQKMGSEMKSKLNSLKGATLAITEVQQLKNDENTKELFYLQKSLAEKVSRIEELENIMKCKEDNTKQVEKNAEVVFAVIKKLYAMNEVEPLDVGVIKMVINELAVDKSVTMDQNQLNMLLVEKDTAGCSHVQESCSIEPPGKGTNVMMIHTIQRCPPDLLPNTELYHSQQTLDERLREDSSCPPSRKILLPKLDHGRHVADEKSKLANDLLLKFEKTQETLEEAELVVNALVKANEDAKNGRDWWKQVSEELLAEKHVLTQEMQRVKTSSFAEAKICGSPQDQGHISLIDSSCSASLLYEPFEHLQKIIREGLYVITCPVIPVVPLGQELLQCTCASRSWLEDRASEIVEKDFATFVLYQCYIEALFQQIMQMNEHTICTKNKHGEIVSSSGYADDICTHIRAEDVAFKKLKDMEAIENNQIFKFSGLGETIEVQNAFQTVQHTAGEVIVTIESADYGISESSSNQKHSQKRTLDSEKDNFELIHDMSWVKDEISKLAIYLDDFMHELNSFEEPLEFTTSTAVQEKGESGSLAGPLLLTDIEKPSYASSPDVIMNDCIQSDISHDSNPALLKSEIIHDDSVKGVITELESLFNDIQQLKGQFAQLVTSQLEVEYGWSLLRQNNSRQDSSIDKHCLQPACVQEEKKIMLDYSTPKTEYGYQSMNALNKLWNNLCCITARFHVGLQVETENRMNRSLFSEVSKGICCIQDKIVTLLERYSRDAIEQLDVVTNTSLLEEISTQADGIVKVLPFDVRFLEESSSNFKNIEDENEEMAVTLAQVENDFPIKTTRVDNILLQVKALQAKLAVSEVEVSSSRLELEQTQNQLAMLSKENTELKLLLKDTHAKQICDEELLEDKNKVIESLEKEIRLISSAGRNLFSQMEGLMDELTRVSDEKQNLHEDVVYLNDKLEMANALADENEAIAVEARQVAEASKIYAEEKEEEVKVLERSVEELEDTINILEKKVYDMKEEVESYQLIRRSLELEVQALRERMFAVENAAEILIADDSSVERESSHIPRQNYDEIVGLCEARKRIEDLEMENTCNTEEIKQYREHISELVLHSEAQSSMYQEKFKSLEAMGSMVNSDPSTTQPASSVVGKTEKTSTRTRGSGSPFRCITSIVQQMNSEKDLELSEARFRIKELEALSASNQKEIYTLTARLATVDSMTHDVIRDLLGVKMDMTNYASLIDQEWLQKKLEKAQQQTEETDAKENETLNLKKQINRLIEERDSWVEEINQRNADLLEYEVTVERLKQRDQLLTAQNELLKIDKVNLHQRIMELDEKVKFGSECIPAHRPLPVQIKENNRRKDSGDELRRRLAQTDRLISHARN